MIDLQKIETFLRAAEKLSLSGSAKQLHLSQPAIISIGGCQSAFHTGTVQAKHGTIPD